LAGGKRQLAKCSWQLLKLTTHNSSLTTHLSSLAHSKLLVMSVIPSENCIQCFFDSETLSSPNLKTSEIEVFYAVTSDLSSEYKYLESYLSQDEKLRADKFHFIEDRNTYISCHGLLRAILSGKLKMNPAEIIINGDKNNKPGLIGNPLYFNVTHVRDAFAFVISNHFYVGIDMEDSSRNIDFIPIINSFFSKKESKFILESPDEVPERFFLIWTRKEALLKALGIGIMTDLTRIEVCKKENTIKKTTFEKNMAYAVSDEHFIYSEKVFGFLLSIALPKRADIILNQINKVNISTLIS
jgi:4'-phosphopantetheinyl transferase